MAKRYHVNFTVEELSGSANVSVERETWEDPGGTTVEDIKVVDDHDGAELDFDDLDDDMQEKIIEAAIDASREG